MFVYEYFAFSRSYASRPHLAYILEFPLDEQLQKGSIEKRLYSSNARWLPHYYMQALYFSTRSRSSSYHAATRRAERRKRAHATSPATYTAFPSVSIFRTTATPPRFCRKTPYTPFDISRLY